MQLPKLEMEQFQGHICKGTYSHRKWQWITKMAWISQNRNINTHFQQNIKTVQDNLSPSNYLM